MSRLGLTKTVLITELANALGITDLKVKEGTALYQFIHSTATEIVKNSEKAEKLLRMVKDDTWHKVVVECESLFKCTDTAESPTMSNLPNLIRNLQNEIATLEIKYHEACVLLAQEAEQRRVLLELQDTDEWVSGKKIGAYLVNSVILEKENKELKRNIAELKKVGKTIVNEHNKEVAFAKQHALNYNQARDTAIRAMAGLVGEKKHSRDTCPKSDTWFANGGACGKARDCDNCVDAPKAALVGEG
ncbi:MAG: hypothetical protein RBR16_12195 [Syntrophus sp. (in: bacteria)]|nr:hypothetical protein [Syntrophus sp. (in: bacteria)]